ncbi:AAA family ATPase [Xanthomonas albilineans]|nr:AAA family ATPase [Xanthomonas albilineans]
MSKKPLAYQLVVIGTARIRGEAMKIRQLKILNFRGICKLEWDLPNEKTFCLIGKGDSTKTTVLEAIRCVFSPQWNHAFNDSDFH